MLASVRRSPTRRFMAPAIAAAFVVGLSAAAPPVQGIPRASYTVFFDAHSAEIKSTKVNTNTLTAFGWRLKRYHPRCVVVSIDAHADSAEAATDIDARRAYAVYTALLDRGMAEEGFSISVSGARNPLIPTAPGVAEARNRRVVLNWAFEWHSRKCTFYGSGEYTCEHYLSDGTECDY